MIVSFRRSHRGGEIAEQEDDEALGQLCSDRVSEHRLGAGFPHSQVSGGRSLTPISALTSRNPNGEGVPLWPAYTQSEQYLKLDLNVSVGQTLKEQEVEFWTDTFP